MNIITRLIRGEKGISPDMYQVMLDSSFYENYINRNYDGITKSVAEKIVERMYPEIEQKVMSDPTFSNRIVNEVLVILANKLSDKGIKNKQS
jgi:hypothetical protein